MIIQFLVLIDIAHLINDVFAGKVTDFLETNELILTQEQKNSLTELFQKLSPMEKEILLKLSQSFQPISIEELTTSLNLEITELINSLQSLQQRYLVKTIESGLVVFKLGFVFQKFLITYYNQ